VAGSVRGVRRYRWRDIPAELRDDVEQHLGSVVTSVREPEAGRTSDLAAVLVTSAGSAFVKGVRQDNIRTLRTLRAELRTNRHLPRSAPRIRWQAENPEWVLVGYEFVAGRHARFEPGSPDLQPMITLLTETTTHTPRRLDVFENYADRWARVSPWHTLARTRPDHLAPWDLEHLEAFAVEERNVVDALAAGRTIVHSDVHQLNTLVVGGRARLVDWAWSSRGPAWVDPAFFAVRLVGAGHTPGEAEDWARQIPAWREADSADLDAFSISVLGMWLLRNRFPELVDAARRYTGYRLLSRRPPAKPSCRR